MPWVLVQKAVLCMVITKRVMELAINHVVFCCLFSLEVDVELDESFDLSC